MKTEKEGIVVKIIPKELRIFFEIQAPLKYWESLGYRFEGLSDKK